MSTNFYYPVVPLKTLTKQGVLFIIILEVIGVPVNPIVRKNVNKLEFQVKKIIAPIILACVLAVSTACTMTAKPEVVDGMVYAKHPKADIISKNLVSDYHWSYLLCVNESQVWEVYVFDNTISIGQSDGSARVKSDTLIPNITCGAKLQELQRLAEIGKKHNNK